MAWGMTSATLSTQTQKRPTGVTVLAVLAIIGGALAILGGLALMAVGTLAGTIGVGANDAGLGTVGAFGAITGAVIIVFGVFELICSYGLFTRRRWAWYATIVIAAGQAVSAIYSFVSGSIFSGIIGLALAGLVVWYLLNPVVQAWFGVSYNAPWAYKQAPPHA